MHYNINPSVLLVSVFHFTDPVNGGMQWLATHAHVQKDVQRIFEIPCYFFILNNILCI